MTLRWTAFVALVAAACQNPCAEICGRMADYAKECELPVSDAEVGACVDRMGQDLTSDDKQACRDYGDPEIIRNQWSCEDLAVYWAPSA